MQSIAISASDTISGFYRVAYDMSAWTNYLAFDASTSDMKEALESLDTIGKVTVSVGEADDNGGRTWLVTFNSNVGDLQVLLVDSTRLAAASGSVAVTVRDGDNSVNSDANAEIICSDCVVGEFPVYYHSQVMSAASFGLQVQSCRSPL